jgi:hypothetical protein
VLNIWHIVQFCMTVFQPVIHAIHITIAPRLAGDVVRGVLLGIGGYCSAESFCASAQIGLQDSSRR